MTVVEGEKRTYPYGRLASHVFGQLSEITAKELELPVYQGYKAGWVIGQNGVEGTYDNWLRGQDGNKRVTIDATGTPLSDQVVRAARSGYRLRLTIDKTVQQEAQQALAAGVRRNKGNGADSGVLIAMDAQTGALRAIASYPNFNPNWFVSPSVKANRGHLRYLETSKTTPQLNRAITGLYPAASTFKPFTAIAAVAVGRAAEHLRHDPVQRQGQDRGARLQQLGPVRGHGDEPADRALAELRHLLLRARLPHLQPRQEAGLAAAALGGQFGFGKPTGIDIAGESQGILPTQGLAREDVHQGDRPDELPDRQAVAAGRLGAARDRPGRARGDAAADRGRLRRDRERRLRRDAAHRRGHRGRLRTARA